MALRALSLCAGVGGLDLGLHRALGPRYRTVCYVEWDAFAASCLVARMGEEALDPAPVWDNLRTFDGAAWRGAVDLVVAGYPCQPFSAAGKKKGAEDPRHLWPAVLRTIGDVGARYVFLENVAGHVRLGLDAVLGDLAEGGFSAEWSTLRASDVGAPHRRERLFVLAWRVSGAERDELREQPEPGDAELVDAEGKRRPEGRAERERRERVSAPHVSGGSLGDAEPGDAGGLPERQGERPGDKRRAPSRAQRQRVASAGGPDLADAAPVLGQGEQRGEPHGDARAVADPDGGRLARERLAQPGGEQGARWGVADGRGAVWRLDDFPPGPDAELWRGVPEHLRPAIPQSELRRLAHGLAAGLEQPAARTLRVDRLRVAGNGVVPAQAAEAFRQLARRAGLAELMP